MELFYCWIKDFKNIKGQGFLFTEKFAIQFLESSGTLEICENKQAINDFFGGNLTAVTAVIGANGSGKSNLLEFLRRRLGSYEENSWTGINGHEGLFVLDRLIFCHISIEVNNADDLKSVGYNILYYDESIRDAALDKRDLLGTREHERPDIYANTYISFSNIFDLRYEMDYQNVVDISTNGLLWIDRYESHRYISYDYDFEIKAVNFLKIYQIEEIRTQLDFIAENEKDEFTLPFDLPRKIYIGLDQKHNKIVDVPYEWFKEKKLMELQNLQGYFFDAYKVESENTDDQKRAFKAIFLYRFLVAMAQLRPESIQSLNYSDMFDIVHGGKLTLFEKVIPDVFPKIKKFDLLLRQILKICTAYRSAILNGSGQTNWDRRFVISFDIVGGKHRKLLFDFVKTYNEIVEDKLFLTFDWWGLSSGQFNMLAIFSRFHRAVKSPLLKGKKHVIVFIDEGETYFHPSWQRDFLDDISKYLKFLFKYKTFQIVITSNSPFIASDLPKSMINFLDRDAQGNCIVVDELKQIKQTFGANIHTLFTDAFFMENSLVGTFARKKIDRLIKVINKEEEYNEEFPNLEEVQKYVDIIGEPILRSLLQERVDSLRLAAYDEISSLKESIRKLDDRLRKLEDNDTN